MEENISPDVLRHEVETRLEELFFGTRGLFAGITHCTAVTEPYLTATLILLFSTIDILGFLDMPASKEENGGDDFQAWTARYLSAEGQAFATDLDMGRDPSLVASRSPPVFPGADGREPLRRTVARISSQMEKPPVLTPTALRP